MSKKQLLLPHCVGNYELGDLTCDGDPDAKNSEDRGPCGWRNRCSGLVCYMQETGKSVGAFVKYVVMDDVEHATPIGQRAKFETLCDEQIKRYGIREGRFSKDPVGDPPPKVDGRKKLRPTKRAIKAASKALTRRAQQRRGELWKLVEHFQTCLAQDLVRNKSPYQFSPPRHVVSHGRLYLVDRVESSAYVSLYVKNQAGRDVPLALLKFKTSNLTIDVELPVEAGSLSKSTRKELGVMPLSDGRFKSISKGLGKYGLSLVSELIANLVKSGKVKLPTTAA